MRSLRLDRPDDRAYLTRAREEALGSPEHAAAVAKILARVRAEGDPAVRALTEAHDHVRLDQVRLSPQALDAAAEACPRELVKVLEQAARNIRAFHLPQRPEGYSLDGGRLRQRVVPLSRVGLYVPGGRAAYPSTVLMNAIPASVAGVPSIAVATPPRRSDEGPLSPAIAAACRVAGVTDVYLMGGAQAVGAFAFGTQTVRRVDKICGPGNAWVAEAKRQVAGRVGIDLFAGPSEVLVLDDGRADPTSIAYDLLAQAEHDPRAVCVCVTTSEQTFARLPAALDEVLAREPNPVARQAIDGQGAVVFASSLDDAVAFAQDFAPEHLQLEADASLVERLPSAGAIFVGGFTPESVGDYLAGPNHTLPTGGTARFASGLGVSDFIKRVNVIAWTEADLRREGEAIARFARAEGLLAHARAVEVRLEKPSRAPLAAPARREPVDYVLSAVRRQRAYTLLAPPTAEVKLNQNEAPEDLPLGLKRALAGAFCELDWRRYPPFDPRGLRERLAQHAGWTAGGVLIGNGSNELLTLLLRSVIGPGEAVVLPDPCFSLYPLHLDVQSAEQRRVALRPEADFAYETDRLLEAAQGAKVVLLVSPNNPTGSVLPPGAVERLLAETNALVIVDEAYREWCGQDLAPLLAEGAPLVLLRTFSKALAIAGLRFGYLLGPVALCAELAKVVLPYSVNALTQLAIEQLLGRGDLVDERVALVTRERARVAAAARARGRRVIEGGANFVLVSSDDPAAELRRLLQRDVLVRDLSSAVPGFLRVSIGSVVDNDRFLEGLAG